MGMMQKMSDMIGKGMSTKNIGEMSEVMGDMSTFMMDMSRTMQRGEASQNDMQMLDRKIRDVEKRLDMMHEK